MSELQIVLFIPKSKRGPKTTKLKSLRALILHTLRQAHHTRQELAAVAGRSCAVITTEMGVLRREGKIRWVGTRDGQDVYALKEPS